MHHGKIAARAEAHYTQLKDYMETLKNSDIILIATHSQGGPTSFLLLKRLIDEGIVQPRIQKVGLLCMAGILHGPFKWMSGNLVLKWGEGDAAQELFELAEVGELTEGYDGPVEITPVTPSGANKPLTAPSVAAAQAEASSSAIDVATANVLAEPDTPVSATELTAEPSDTVKKADKRTSTSSYFTLVTDVARKISFSSSTSVKNAVMTKRPSVIAKSTQNAIRTVLESGVVVTCVASWKDQVVPVRILHTLVHDKLIDCSLDVLCSAHVILISVYTSLYSHRSP